ncbi:hypothetical protein Tco_1231946 [Tanacetum coccineum]
MTVPCLAVFPWYSARVDRGDGLCQIQILYSELILDTDSDEDEQGDEDSDEDREDKSLDTDDKREGLDDEDHGLDDEGHSLDEEGLSLEGSEEEAVHEGQQQASLIVETAVGEPLGLSYRALRHRELAVEEDQVYNTFDIGQDPKDDIAYIHVPTYPPPAPPVQTPPSPEWSSGSLPISPAPFAVPSPISSPMISLTVPSPIASPVSTPTATIPVDEDRFIEIGAQLELYEGILQDHTQCLDAMPPTLFVDIDRDMRELYTRSGVVRGEIFSQRYRFRSLKLEQERTALTFGALWRTVLALEAWTGYIDT